MSDGNNNDLVIGFQVSDSIFFNQSEEIIVEGDFGEGDIFEASFDFSHITTNRIYFRAFARNSLFESFGSKKRAKIPAIETIPKETLFPDAYALEGGWKENWLGVFQEYPNRWIYHLDLGWCFVLRMVLGEFGFGPNYGVGYGQMNKLGLTFIKMTLQVGCICSAGKVVLL